LPLKLSSVALPIISANPAIAGTIGRPSAPGIEPSSMTMRLRQSPSVRMSMTEVMHGPTGCSSWPNARRSRCR
jgi:hypothetical protein